ncbi:hypothetical protein C1645_744576 [Glomus cerebriforme]|uniref:Uncharacterized protein n=1 Tax=Glomus cerebriforme TaxID=658196 RepID=A0A397S9E3_9GLOM|nr:hypothetical protein C1645_744576 [Glomus cerebriforme]
MNNYTEYLDVNKEIMPHKEKVKGWKNYACQLKKKVFARNVPTDIAAIPDDIEEILLTDKNQDDDYDYFFRELDKRDTKTAKIGYNNGDKCSVRNYEPVFGDGDLICHQMVQQAIPIAGSAG